MERPLRFTKRPGGTSERLGFLRRRICAVIPNQEEKGYAPTMVGALQSRVPVIPRRTTRTPFLGVKPRDCCNATTPWVLKKSI